MNEYKIDKTISLFIALISIALFQACSEEYQYVDIPIDSFEKDLREEVRKQVQELLNENNLTEIDLTKEPYSDIIYAKSYRYSQAYRQKIIDHQTPYIPVPKHSLNQLSRATRENLIHDAFFDAEYWKRFLHFEMTKPGANKDSLNREYQKWSSLYAKLYYPRGEQLLQEKEINRKAIKKDTYLPRNQLNPSF